MKKIPSHFMIPVSNMERSIAFYEDVLELKLVYKTDEWSEFAFDNEIDLALRKVTNKAKLHAGIGFSVKDCEQKTRELEKKGAKVITRCEFHEADQLILTQIKDPDGNVVWFSEHLKS